MATKVVYFTVAGREEQAEFRSSDNTEEVRGMLVFTYLGLIIMLYRQLMGQLCCQRQLSHKEWFDDIQLIFVVF